MAKWSIAVARIEEETPERLEILPQSYVRRQRVILSVLLILFGFILLGLFSGDAIYAIVALTIFLMPAFVLLFVIPLATKIILDTRKRTITLIKARILGVGQWSSHQEKTIDFSSIKRIAHKPNWLGSAHQVEMSTVDGMQINMQFGPREDEAKRVGNKIAETIGPTVVSELGLEEEPESLAMPLTAWRLGLASVYGLVSALVLGYLWFLVVTASSTKFGYVALLIGVVVGIVVSFMCGGSKDVRCAILGAILSGAGIAFGEFLIFGLPDSEYIYEFDLVDLVIYAIAIYEGWIIPRRSIPLVRRKSHIINKDNRMPILLVGAAALALVIGLVATAGRLPTPEGTAAKVHYDRAVKLLEDGRFDEAISEFEEAIKNKPDYALAHNDLGTVYYSMGRLGDAEVEFEKAVQADPSLALAHANLANVYNDQGRFEEGIKEANEALRLDSSLPSAHLISGYLNANLGNIVEAQAEFEKTIELDPSIPDPHVMLGLLSTDQANWGLAIERFSTALDLEMSPQDMSMVYAFRAMAHGTLANYEEAMEDTDEAIRLDSSNAFAYYIRGLIYSDLGERSEAISDLERSLELGLDPETEQYAESVLENLKR